MRRHSCSETTRRVEQREQPDDAEEDEERRDVRVGRGLAVEPAEALAPGAGARSPGNPAGWRAADGGPARPPGTVSRLAERYRVGVEQSAQAPRDVCVSRELTSPRLVHDAWRMPSSIRVSACCIASLMAKYLGPLTGLTVTALARSAKIWPVGALLKNGDLDGEQSSGLSSAATWLGKAPTFLKALICCSGAVSQAASALASAWVLRSASGRSGTSRPSCRRRRGRCWRRPSP